MALTPAAANYMKASDNWSMPPPDWNHPPQKPTLEELHGLYQALNPDDRKSLRQYQAVELKAAISRQLADPKVDPETKAVFRRELQQIEAGYLPSLPSGPPINIETGEAVAGSKLNMDPSTYSGAAAAAIKQLR